MTSSPSSRHKSHKQLFNQLALANPKQRYSQMSSSISKEPALELPTPVLNSIFSHSSHAYRPLHKQKANVSKKDLISRPVPRQNQQSLGRTPFEDRKIGQKEKSNKILEKILAKSKQKQVLQHSQQEWMIVRQLNHQKTEQQKEAQQIRETDISLQQQTEEPFQRYSQNHSEIFDSNFMVNSWLFPCSHFQSAQKKINNKKMTLKQLWRTKGQNSKPCFNETLKSFFGENHRAIHTDQRQSVKEMILRKGGNPTKCQTQPAEEVENYRNYSIHSRKTKKAGKMSKYLQKETGSALKIQPYQLQNSQQQIKNQSLYNSFSESKIKLVKDPKYQVCKYRSIKHFKRQLTDQQIIVKEISAWEIPNDFSERETLI